MTVRTLSLEYAQTAAVLRCRIVELERASRETEDEAIKHSLDSRARPLRSMYRDTRKVAQHLEHYYDKYVPGQIVKAGAKEGRS